MVRQYVIRGALALAALAPLGGRPAGAAPIQFTGNVNNDFALAPGNGVVQIIAHPLPDGAPDPNYVSQQPWITANGWTTGWAMRDMRLQYNKATDTLAVGISFFSIAGNVDGNGTPGYTDPQLAAKGATDTPHLGGQKSITVGIEFGNSTAFTPDIVAGVPADKRQAGPGIDGFNIAKYVPSASGMQYDYGATLTNNMGGLAFDPSKQHPDFEFTIKNFSKLPGYSATKGFTIAAFAGSPNDIVVGQDAFAPYHVTLPSPELAPPPHTPEPATLLAWSTALVGGAAIRHRRRRARA